MRGSMSGAMPRPLSATLSTAWRVLRRTGHRDLTARVGVLRRIRQEVGRHLGQTRDIPVHHQPSWNVDGQ